MQYVKRADVMNKFMAYIKEYDGDLISKNAAISELEDALEDAEYQEIDDDY